MNGSRTMISAVAIALTLVSAKAAQADELPDVAILGAALSRTEIDQARLFCQAALGQELTPRLDPELTCDCFQLQWEKRSNRLHRLALAISLAPGSAQARSAVWTIAHAQDGLHEAKLETLSVEFRGAAQAAMASCLR